MFLEYFVRSINILVGFVKDLNTFLLFAVLSLSILQNLIVSENYFPGWSTIQYSKTANFLVTVIKS